jgi:hypothetical protein
VRTVLVVILIVSAAQAEARLRWPWERPMVTRHRPMPERQAQPMQRPDTPGNDEANCEQINAALAALDVRNLDRALRAATRFQLRVIAKCQTMKR